jgi:hypothetical protein
MLLGIPAVLNSVVFSFLSTAPRDGDVSCIGNLVGVQVAPFLRVLTKPIKQTRSTNENDIGQYSVFNMRVATI